MRVALLNPNWRFDGSIYFGCTEPHLPLELGYTQALLQRDGHEAMLFDAALGDWSLDDLHARFTKFSPDCTVLATAPSYLFWRCPPPELRIPRQAVQALRPVMGRLIVVGPHACTTPGAALMKLDADLAVLGECEEVVCKAVAADAFSELESVAYYDSNALVKRGPRAMADLGKLPALHWPDGLVRRHRHHHHRFDRAPDGYGAEVEASRGCPYACSFCAKQDHRDLYRKRPLAPLIEEIDALIGQGVTYLYFIDEIFLPDRPLLEALRERPVRFGVQTRIDLWKPDMLDLLAAAGCVSIEAGVESISHAGREEINKRCRLSTDQLSDRLLHARRGVPFVQASLLDGGFDGPEEVKAWREGMIGRGVWVNVPVPMFPYPGSLDYLRRWGAPDDRAWERAVDFYRDEFGAFSDIQNQQPLPVETLERLS